LTLNEFIYLIHRFTNKWYYQCE